ncbi:MAG: hypothetical protein QNJ70_26650 [Xenococcaceae cyanobacterium MO_207.B15]|nr:hypothetical protein [Xenococcaceae cyanobacterium MO_207.B15]
MSTIIVNGTSASEILGPTGSLDSSYTIMGFEGDDEITGGNQDDFLYGYDFGGSYFRDDSGRDTLTGGAGDDLLDGGLGDDILTGGAGADVFQFLDPALVSYNIGIDVVKDFNVDELDKIQIVGNDSGATSTLDDITADSYGSFTLLSYQGSSFAILEGVSNFEVTSDTVEII